LLFILFFSGFVFVCSHYVSKVFPTGSQCVSQDVPNSTSFFTPMLFGPWLSFMNISCKGGEGVAGQEAGQSVLLFWGGKHI
jgi:hypothetical protein